MKCICDLPGAIIEQHLSVGRKCICHHITIKMFLLFQIGYIRKSFLGDGACAGTCDQAGGAVSSNQTSEVSFTKMDSGFHLAKSQPLFVRISQSFLMVLGWTNLPCSLINSDFFQTIKPTTRDICLFAKKKKKRFLRKIQSFKSKCSVDMWLGYWCRTLAVFLLINPPCWGWFTNWHTTGTLTAAYFQQLDLYVLFHLLLTQKTLTNHLF